jgi:hypothetical protein
MMNQTNCTETKVQYEAHMTDKNELKSLLETPKSLCISLYLPLDPNAVHANRVRAHNLLKYAEKKLTEMTCATEVEGLLQPTAEAFHKLLEKPEGRGLAAFASEGFHREFLASLDLPELAITGRRFHILPLLPLLSGDDRFYILALSQKRIRLYEANRMRAHVVSSADFVGAHQGFLSEGFEKELQFHTAGAGGSGKRGVIYHGGADEPKDRFAEYLRQVITGLFKNVSLGGAPLVLASIERIASLYREINSYPNLVKDFARGNPELLNFVELHAKTWEAVEPYFAAQHIEFVERFKRFPEHLIDYDGRAITASAQAGRVRTLLIASDRKRNTEAEELLNAAASDTLRHSGAVYELPVAEMPEGAEIAAAYRY